MPPKLLLTALGIAIASLTGSAYLIVQEKPPKPVKERTTHFDGGRAVPDTFEGLWSISSLIVDATISGSRPADTVLTSPSDGAETVTVQTAYRLKITEIFKDSLDATKGGAPIEVLQVGGDRDRGDHIESVSDPTAPKLRVGERYLFFLERARGAGAAKGTFRMATGGPDSVAVLADDETVQNHGKSKVSEELGRYSRVELLHRLRDRAQVKR